MNRVLILFLFSLFSTTSFAEVPIDCRCTDKSEYSNGRMHGQLVCSNGYEEVIRAIGPNDCLKRILQLQEKVGPLGNGDCACLSIPVPAADGKFHYATELVKKSGNAPEFVNQISQQGPFTTEFWVGSSARPGKMSDLQMCELVRRSLEISGVCKAR